MSESRIEPLLRKAFFAAVTDSEENTALENQPFDPAGKDIWFMFRYLPNTPDVATLGSGGSDAFDGIAQIDVNIPNGDGTKGLSTVTEALRTTFAAGTRLLDGVINITIRSCGRSGGGRPVGAFWRYTWTISWETRISRIVPEEPDFILWGDGEEVGFDP